jgi:hypothetical protein
VPTKSFRQAIHDKITDGAIGVRVQTTGAIVLERIAMGGGATRWYSCPDSNHLAALEAQLSPGSQVSFYFDGRIHVAPASPDAAGPMKRIIAETGDVVAGVLASDDLHLDMQVISGPTEVDEFIAAVGDSEHLFYGPFPSSDDDGVNAITMVLPDLDGVVRPHPY